MDQIFLFFSHVDVEKIVSAARCHFGQGIIVRLLSDLDYPKQHDPSLRYVLVVDGGEIGDVVRMTLRLERLGATYQVLHIQPQRVDLIDDRRA